MIYTSYFAMINKLPKNIIPISICGKAPDWYKGLQYKKLAPKYDFFMKYKRDHNEQEYIKCYNEQVLDKIEIDKLIYELCGLLDINEDINICLLCYEKTGDFCHRHLVSKWLNEHGYKCEEYIYKNIVNVPNTKYCIDLESIKYIAEDLLI